MYGKINFNVALFVSVSLHFAAFFPYSPPAATTMSARNLETLFVDYYVLEETKAPTPAPPEAPAVTIEKERTPKPAVAVKEQEPDPEPVKKEEIAEEREEPPFEKVKAKIIEAAKKLQEDRVFNKYYKKVRDEIKRRLKKNYTDFSEQGDVYLVFSLNSDGKLQNYRINTSRSTKDKLLLEVAELSLIEASPFPKFPKGLSRKQIVFNVVVSFAR